MESENVMQPSKTESGWLTSRGWLALVCAFALWMFVLARPGSPPPGWGDDYEQAVAKAVETNRPLVVAFTSRGCPPCQAMDRHVLPDPRVVDALSGFVAVRVDAPRRPRLMQRFRVPGTPTYCIITPAGTVVSQLVGFHSADEFVGFLSAAGAAP